jgi:hypothetical protein
MQALTCSSSSRCKSKLLATLQRSERQLAHACRGVVKPRGGGRGSQQGGRGPAPQAAGPGWRPGAAAGFELGQHAQLRAPAGLAASCPGGSKAVRLSGLAAQRQLLLQILHSCGEYPSDRPWSIYCMFAIACLPLHVCRCTFVIACSPLHVCEPYVSRFVLRVQLVAPLS